MLTFVKGLKISKASLKVEDYQNFESGKTLHINKKSIIMKSLIPMSDQQLIHLYVGGNAAAFSTLVLRHKSKIYSSIYLLVKDKYLAERAANDEMKRVFSATKASKEVACLVCFSSVSVLTRGRNVSVIAGRTSPIQRGRCDVGRVDRR